MALKEHINDIRKRLEQNIFKSETAVRQGIVDPLLRSLGWPTDDTLVVFPEYPVGSGHVDYALCHPSSTPRVFIEAKQVGNIKGAEEQLFGYDSRIRVPIAVLTDGREWQFFHPTGEGTWAERKVCEFDLTAGDSEENAEKLNRYLNYESIRTGEAVEAIKKDYEKVVQQRQVATRLPEAWSKLVEEADEFLLLAVAEKTESLCGYRPTDGQVLNFLKSLKRVGKPLYCLRFFRPLPKGRLCYNTISIERSIRWRNEENSPLSLRPNLFSKLSAVAVPKQKCVGTIISTKINSHSGSDTSLKMRPYCLSLRISNLTMPRSVSPTLSSSLGEWRSP